MNRFQYIIYIISLALFVGACKKEVDNVFGARPDDRLQELLNTDSSTLVNSQYGWKGILTPDSIGTGAYFFHFNFATNGTTTMVCDFDTITAKTPATSTYRLKAIQLPALIFDSYNYIHRLSDPDTTISHGAVGKGLYTDFEFYFNTVTPDSVTLTGTRNKSKLVLTKATKIEADAFKNGALKSLMDNTSKYVSANTYMFILFPDGRKLPFGMSVRNKTIVMQYVNESNAIVNLTSSFYFTQNSLHLTKPITYNGYTFQDIYYDATANVYYVIINGTRVNIQNATTALTLSITPELYTQLGNKYTDIYINPTTQAGLPPSFNTLWADCKAKLAALSGRVPLYLDVIFPTTTQMQLSFRYNNSAGSGFTATYTYSMVIDPVTHAATFTYLTQNANGTTTAQGWKPFTDYIVANKFTFGYVANTSSSALLGGLFNTTDAASFFFGELK